MALWYEATRQALDGVEEGLAGIVDARAKGIHHDVVDLPEQHRVDERCGRQGLEKVSGPPRRIRGCPGCGRAEAVESPHAQVHAPGRELGSYARLTPMTGKRESGERVS